MTLKELVAGLTRRQLYEITFTYDLQFNFSCVCPSYLGIVPYALHNPTLGSLLDTRAIKKDIYGFIVDSNRPFLMMVG